MRSTLPLRAIRLRHVLREPRSWVHQMPVVTDLRERGRLEFPSPVTVLSGENGVGKSTLLEALALKLGFGATGGRLDDPFKQSSTGTESPLVHDLVADLSQPLLRGYFLRAESHLTQVLHNQSPMEAAGRNRLEADWDITARSHGESIFDIFHEYIDGAGLYLLDEPEAGLSTIRQMALLGQIAEEVRQGAQFVIATHSPILMAFPGTTIYEIGDRGIRTTALEQTEAFTALAEFFADPHGTVDFLLGE
ncbi:AAA family ATPase [Corynebacterium urealyticum]|uniref:AAA family ATPase n=1 Tax=Corynebacterium urealyticum TaxID=43771 RepID=A0A5D4FYJ9_9CORY|nr:AAA family ATPase [Corynebacterium urealyticum]TYR20369.1 AAA family ATPase [Corynebacterium urealyticum]